MPAVEQALISFFGQVAQKDEAQLAMLKQNPSFRVEQGRWCFTLPDLFSYLQHQDGVFSGMEYKQFRQLVFNSPINQTTKLYGAEITITDNRAKVDQSGYALVWRAG